MPNNRRAQPKADKFIIGKIASPSKPPVILEEKIVFRVRRSLGGFLYGTFLDPLAPNSLVRFKDYIEDEIIQLNTAFIEQVRERMAVKIESDLTGNFNYSNSYKRGIRIYVMKPDAEFELVDQANVDVAERNAELVFQRLYNN